MSPEMKSSWKDRSNLLNRRPLVGQVEMLPEKVGCDGFSRIARFFAKLPTNGFDIFVKNYQAFVT